MKKKEIYLILDNIRSRENVGSIFRSADAFGVTKIFLCGITPVPSTENYKSQIPNSKQISNSKFQIQSSDKIAKTALGAQTWMPWEYRKQTWRCLLELKKQNSKVKVIALEQGQKSKNLYRFKPGFPMALVLGNEVKGVSKKLLAYCSYIVEIPMRGRKESLNVAVAAGITLYSLTTPHRSHSLFTNSRLLHLYE